MKKRAIAKTSRVGHPVRNFLTRYASLFLILLAAALMVAGRMDNQTVTAVRMFVSDVTAPVLQVVARPVNIVIEKFDHATDLPSIRSENIRLRAENLRLRQWYETALRLEAENKSLKGLLNVVPEAERVFITGRIVADAGGAFVRSFLVSAGADDGVKKGQAVVTAKGFIGRVTEVGDSTARVLMMTDLNARVPVMIENTLHRAILAGNNTDLPDLLYLPSGSNVEAGARLVTSGHGGMLPPGIAVGKIHEVTKSGITVQPYADFDRLVYVQIIDAPLELSLETGELAVETQGAP